MMSLPLFLMSDEQRKFLRDRQAQAIQRRIPLAVPWDAEMKWQPELTLQAKTYKPRSLFDVPASNARDVNDALLEETIHSPKKTFCYIERRLKRGAMLENASGQKRGNIMWDGPIVVPSLHERSPHHADFWASVPWMSITPFELMTLRSGTKRAKGRTLVVGLGLGHQLIEVSKRKQVKELVLVERSQELVDWLLPRIKPHLGCELKDVVIGDAYKKLPKMKADVALIDIFPRYGFNKFEKLVSVNERLNEWVPVACPNIKSLWCWGSAQLKD